MLRCNERHFVYHEVLADVGNSRLWCSGCRCTDSCSVDVRPLAVRDPASPAFREAPVAAPPRYLCCCGRSGT